MDRMNILVSSNDDYVMPLCVLLQSLFDTNPGSCDVWFLESGLSSDSRAVIDGLAARHGAAVTYVAVGDDEFAGLPTKKYISRETYFRLLAAQLLPASVDRVLWLDADMVVNGPIDGFYRTDFEGAAVVACPHGPAMRETIASDCELLGIDRPEQYFNAGVMLCNLAVWREMDVPGRIAQVAAQPRKMMFPGQDFTNLIFCGRVKTADWRIWNCMIHSVEPHEIPELARTAKIIHFVGSAKPWRFFDIPFADIWRSWYDKSPFADEPLRLTSHAKMRALYERMQSKGKHL